MKKLSFIILLPFLIFACGGSDENVREESVESRDFSPASIQKLKIDTENGNIQAIAKAGDSINITLTKWATGSDSIEAKKNIDDIEVSINEDTGSQILDIDIDVPDNTTADYGCEVSAEIPASMEMELESLNGAITIVDTEGKAKLKTLNGRIAVANHRGDLDGETSNGGIDADVILPDDGECILRTSNGSIVLSIPGSASAEIEASTLNGRIEIDHPGVLIDSMENNEFRGEIGGGEGYIKLEARNGNITIERR